MNNDKRRMGIEVAWLGAALAMLLPLSSLANSPSRFQDCIKHAQTQMDVNDCARDSLRSANAELARVYSRIKTLYKDDPAFLKRLARDQEAWRHLRDADFAMMYPHTGDPGYYGSAFPTCAAKFKATLVRQRAEFLRRWLRGAQDGDLCAGSVKMHSQLK